MQGPTKEAAEEEANRVLLGNFHRASGRYQETEETKGGMFMSGVIQRETSVAAGGVNDNIFSGSAFEYVRQPGVVSIAAVASATGGFITLQAGPTLILEESPPTVKVTMPTVPDDFLYQSAVVPGDRLVLRFRNPTAGALVLRAVAQLSP